MEQSVTIKYRWTAEELLKAYRYHFRHVCRPVFRFGLHLLFIFILAGGVAILIKDGGQFSAMPYAFILVGVYWFTLRPFERRWMIRRQFAKRPDKDTDVEWQFAGDKLTAKSVLGHGEYEWHGFTKVVLTPTGLMLYSTDQHYHWLPRHSFSNEEEYSGVVELAKNKIKKFYELA